MAKSTRQGKTDGAPEAPNGYFDPQSRRKARDEDKRLQDQYNKLCGPVTVRQKGDEK